MDNIKLKISTIGTVIGGLLVGGQVFAQQTAAQLFPTASVSELSETVLDRAIDVLWAYWPTILTVAVTIGIAFFLIAKAMRAVRGKI